MLAGGNGTANQFGGLTNQAPTMKASGPVLISTILDGESGAGPLLPLPIIGSGSVLQLTVFGLDDFRDTAILLLVIISPSSSRQLHLTHLVLLPNSLLTQ